MTGFSDFNDIDAVLRLPRLTSITARDGRVVLAIGEADEPGSRVVSSLWEASSEHPARRLTFSKKGESNPHLAADGSLWFTSARPDPQGKDGDDGVAAVWRLPASGEASVVASAPGGLSLIGVADNGTALAATAVLAGGSLEVDAERRKARKEAKRSDIWHTGMPIRYWDHEVGDVSPRLVLIGADGSVSDLLPRADTVNLLNSSACLSADGSTVYATWQTRTSGGGTQNAVIAVDVATSKKRTVLKPSSKHRWASPMISPDGTRLAVIRHTTSTPTDTNYDFLEVHPVDGGEPVRVDLGDLTIGGGTWADATTVVVNGDWHSRGQIVRVDASSGKVTVLVDDASYSSVSVDGGRVFALRSTIAEPARPVQLKLKGRQAVTELDAPGAISAVPGSLEWVETDVDGVSVGGWLCLPKGASKAKPAPVMLWIHGGPHGSYNAWGWRWIPWLAVARGWAVLMPDPGMSTGYGHAGLNRGWPRLADVVWRECETLFDQVLRRPSLDAERTALLGASFGGFMTNWIAGHSDRFGAIVTHAGLWALDQQHPTTDAAHSKVKVHGHPDDHEQWYRTYSPHHSAANITTPMLVTHGNRDYRVPVSEGLRLWWDLVSGWKGKPADLPHRFLQFQTENHWVLTPSNARVWNEAVLGFCGQHVLGDAPLPQALE